MKRKIKIKVRSFGTRVFLFYLMFLASVGLISARLYAIQVSNFSYYRDKALAQQLLVVNKQPERGEIFFQDKTSNLYPAAINKRFFNIAINPSQIKENHNAIARLLAEKLGLLFPEVLEKVNRSDDPYEILLRHANEEQVRQVTQLGISALVISEELLRFYPNENLASHVLGFVGMDGQRAKGQYGVEAFYENVLSGKHVGVDQLKKLIEQFSLWGAREKTLENGASLVLTIDPILQKEAERLLKEETERWKAKSGNVIVMDPKTGAIKAMANYPDFNPNNYAKQKDFSVFMNSSVQLRYEPGSVFKPFTLAAGIQSGKVGPETEYFDSGEVRIDNKVIHNAGNAKPNKMVSMSLFLQRSYNLGAVFIEKTVGDEYFKDFIINQLGFADKTEIDLPNEVYNSFSNFYPPEGRHINFANASFGQGIAITPIKLLQEFAAFANKGLIVRPYVVASIRYPSGKVKQTKPQVIKRVISEQTVQKIIPLLEDVVYAEKGSGRLARISGYRIAGKTGTGDIAREDGRGYYNDRINHTFVGFGPVSDPRLVILTRLEDPKGVRYAEATAVPLFRKIMKFALDYYGIPPDKIEDTVQP